MTEIILVEIFKYIDGYLNYEVSNFGRVRNIKSGRFLKPRTSRDGYHVVNLYQNGKMKTETIHRLVAQEFIENPDNKKCIDHIDRNKTNNAIIRRLQNTEAVMETQRNIVRQS